MWPIFKAQFSNFNGLGAVKDIILEQNAFNTIFLTCIHNFSALPTSKAHVSLIRCWKIKIHLRKIIFSHY